MATGRGRIRWVSDLDIHDDVAVEHNNRLLMHLESRPVTRGFRRAMWDMYWRLDVAGSAILPILDMYDDVAVEHNKGCVVS